MANSVARRVGIPGTSTAHWGEHMCAFFYTKTNLLNLVVPYIQAGLEDNEFCLWITEENMEEEALEALRRALPAAPEYLLRKQLEILPASQWYLTSGMFDAGKSFTNWAARGRAAEANGLWGLGQQAILSGFSPKRIGTNSSFMSRPSTRPLKRSE